MKINTLVKYKQILSRLSQLYKVAMNISTVLTYTLYSIFAVGMCTAIVVIFSNDPLGTDPDSDSDSDSD